MSCGWMVRTYFSIFWTTLAVEMSDSSRILVGIELVVFEPIEELEELVELDLVLRFSSKVVEFDRVSLSGL